MNVLFLSQIVPYPPHGGVLQRGYNLLRELCKYNEVDLMAFIHPDILGTKELIDESKRELEKFCRSVEFFSLWPKKSVVHRQLGFLSAVFTSMPFSVLAHKSAAFHKRLEEKFSAGRVDLVHFDTIGLAQFNTMHSVPKILTHHNIESVLMERRALVETNIVAKLYLQAQVAKMKRYEIAQSPLFDVNVTVSDIDGSKLHEIVGDLFIETVPNGVDTEYFKPVPGCETPSLIYAGGMNMFANCDAVLYFIQEIWPIIKASRPDVLFFAVGQDPPPALIDIAKKDSSVKITGFVTDVRPYISRASVYVVPLRVGGGTRLKVLDAMAMGKAIVSTSIGCEGINVSDGNNILLADAPHVFAEKVVNILNDRTLMLKLGNEARNSVVENYSWTKIGKKLQNVYETAVSNMGRTKR